MPTPPAYRPQRLLVAALALALADIAAAQAVPDVPPLQLVLSPDLGQRLAPEADRLSPLFIDADQITGEPDIEVQADGNVQLRRHSVVLKADSIHDDLVTDDVDARGHVRIVRDGNVFSGPQLQLNLDTNLGQMPEVEYFFNRTQGHGEAKAVEFLGRDHVSAQNATYTTCTANPVDWVLQATDLDLNLADNTGVARDGSVKFMGATILPLPYASFPLTDERKSGLLPPSISIDTSNGVDYAQPYYWNIAPNYDATLTPHLMLRRGILGSAETRWLTSDASGDANLNYMPSDRAADGAQRWAAVFQQSGKLSTDLSYGLDLQKVSDDNWWQDFGAIDPVIQANRTLPQQGQLTWNDGNAQLQASFNRWQTLQTAASPIAVPYNIQPRLFGSWSSADPTGLQWQVQSEAARFTTSAAGMLSGDRVYLNPSVSLPFLAPQGFITPTLELRGTAYQTDTPMADGLDQATRALPTFTLDSGLVFERATQFFSRDVTQTLEPRLYYVYTPYRNQDNLPNFDSAPLDLNLASIFTDNVFSGNDRIADANNVTAGVTTRFLNAGDGAEYARLTLAQRALLTQQRVTLTGAPVARGLNDTFALGSIALDPHWSTDAGVDYNLRGHQLVQGAVTTRWQPRDFNNLSVSYQIQSATATQIPLKYVNTAWQWRLSGRWYSVGQANYSIQDKQLNNGLFGFEYDGGCWVGRIVVQRSSLTTSTAATRLLFELQLSGLSHLGNNPLSALEQNIPGYQLLNQPAASPSRYANYE